MLPFRPRFLGQVHINLGQRFGALPPGFIVSPITGMLIPTFPIDITHGGKTERLNVGFDTGMTGTHLEIPTSLAEELGIMETHKEGGYDASGSSQDSVGFIDRISSSDNPSCAVERAKVIFHDDAPLLIGNDFIRDIGARIIYEDEGPRLICRNGPSAPDLYLPIFPISIMHRGKILNAEALFDTGWESADIALPSKMADQLGLPIVGQITVSTHTGDVTKSLAKADRVALQETGECYVDDAVVSVHPRGSELDKRGEVIVGEPFFKRTGGKIGYDDKGAYFACAASRWAVRSVRMERVPFHSDVIGEGIPTWAWITAGLAAVTGGIIYFATRS